MAIFKRTVMTLACASFMLLNACSSRLGSVSHAEESGLTVSQLYHQSLDTTSWTAPHYRAKHTDYEGYTRTAANETNVLFKPLDNPSVPMFVYPHVALIGDEQLLKPGYTTAFFLYKQNQFALPSERY